MKIEFEDVPKMPLDEAWRLLGKRGVYQLLVAAGKPRALAEEAVETLPGASWDELMTYGESGEPEAQTKL